MNEKFKTINLDDEQEVNEFIAKYGTLLGRILANRLGIKGKGSVGKANSLSCYAWNKKTAISLRKEGKIEMALIYEKICDSIYSKMSDLIKW